MLIHLKRNEKLYINGAVVRLDRRGTIQLLNDANFLMENHIMQPEEATTPLRQVYFLVQVMIMDPQNAHLMMELFKVNVAQLRQITAEPQLLTAIETFEGKVLKSEYFEAMKIIRQNFAVEDRIASEAHPAGGSSKAAA
jgi:flagellar protein FlbT